MAVAVQVVEDAEAVEVEQHEPERVSERPAWATIRRIVSSAARRLGSPVSASLTERCSAQRQLPLAGEDRRRPPGRVAQRGVLACGDPPGVGHERVPMISLPDTSGSQRRRRRSAPHTPQGASGLVTWLRAWLRPRRMARHERAPSPAVRMPCSGVLVDGVAQLRLQALAAVGDQQDAAAGAGQHPLRRCRSAGAGIPRAELGTCSSSSSSRPASSRARSRRTSARARPRRPRRSAAPSRATRPTDRPATVDGALARVESRRRKRRHTARRQRARRAR